MSQLSSQEVYGVDKEVAFQQTTSSLFGSTLVISLLTTFIALTLFSYVRTKRDSIFASRRFFVRTEFQADSLPVSFWGWIDGLMFLESRLERVMMCQATTTPNTAFVPDTSTTAGSITPPCVHGWSLLTRFMRSPRNTNPASEVLVEKGAGGQAVIEGVDKGIRITNARQARQETAATTMATTPSSSRPPMSSMSSSAAITATTSGASTSGRQALIAKTGLDHYLLIRFLKMLFSFSATMGGFAMLVLVPLYSVGQSGEDLSQYMPQGQPPPQRIESLQIGNVTDKARLWAAVVVTSIVPVVSLVWCWYELMTYLKLRQEFLFRSSTRSSSRVVLLRNLPPSFRSVQSLVRLFSDSPGGGVEHVYLIRNTQALERAVKQRQDCLDRLEQAEVQYMDAIARASALVASTTLLRHSRSLVGRIVDGVQSFLGGRAIAFDSKLSYFRKAKEEMEAVTPAPSTGEGRLGSGKLNQHPDEEDYVGPLKLYQLEDVPQLSLTDLSNPGLYGSSSTSTGRAGDNSVSTAVFGAGEKHGGGSSIDGASTMASGLSTLKWFQKPRRPRHFIGIPFLSKRKDSIRYYRGELCRLNKKIAQLSEEQRKAVAADQELQERTHTELQKEHGQRRQPRQRHDQQQSTPPSRGADLLPDGETTRAATASEPLSSAFLLMRTRAGARSIASGTVAPDVIASHMRILGITPRDIDWRALGQDDRSKLGKLFGRIMVLGVGAVLLVGCGLVVSAIASMSVSHSWKRVSTVTLSGLGSSVRFAEDKLQPTVAVSMRQGILAPLLLTGLMLAASWILNELCQYWGRVSKVQTELAIQRYYFLFLVINVGLIHPISTLSLSRQESVLTTPSSQSTFLVHAIPSYCSFAFSYILVAGLALPLCQLLQLPRLIATLPAITLWSTLGPLSWRKSTLQSRGTHERKHATDTTADSSQLPSSIATATLNNNDSHAGNVHDENASLFEANFAPAPTLTPRQAFQLRQPPFFQLHNLYPHLILLFTLSLTLLPLSPLLFLLWIFVLGILNLSYRYLILQVVTTKSQSGGLHYRQAIGLLMFPTVACPPFALTLFLFTRQAWVQAGIMVVVLLAIVGARVMIGRQYDKREQRMLSRVESFHLQPKVRLDTRDATAMAAATGFQPPRKEAQGSISKGEPTLSTEVADATNDNEAVVDLSQLTGVHSPLADSPLDLEPGYLLSGASHGDGVDGVDPTTGDPTDAEELYLSPVRRRMKRIMQRPTTIIGQVRHSLVASIISQGASSTGDGSSSPRPKSVPVFDLDRYEKEILGGASNRDDQDQDGEGRPLRSRPKSDRGSSHHEGSTSLIESLQIRRGGGGGRHGEGERSVNSTPREKVARDILNIRTGSDQHARAYTTTATTTAATDRSLAQYDQDLFGTDSHSFFSPSYNGGPPPPAAVRSKAEEVEDEKEAKYREIVMALRRATSVASRNAITMDSRRAQTAGPSSALEAVAESKMTTGQFTRKGLVSGSGGGAGNVYHHASLPNLLNTFTTTSSPPLHTQGPARHLQNPYLHPALHSTLSIASTSSISAHVHGSGGAPSLPMLLIHRETAVAAKKTSRIQNLYLNPVLQEARAKVMVWLPSQTEVSFMGGPNASVTTSGSRARADWGHCKYHAALRAMGPIHSNAQSGIVGAGVSDRLDSAHRSQEGGADGTNEEPAPSSILQGTDTARSNRYPCTCQVYKELLKYVADAVALADQEIRDLRTVGLTVWLDSRHVVWGTEKEEDGRLGDRVMVSNGPVFGGISSGFRGPSPPQRQIGDGLLSWLEHESPASERHLSSSNHASHLGQGATGIIGGSIGVIMKRPIGAYGRLVGDGEEDDIPRGWHGM